MLHLKNPAPLSKAFIMLCLVMLQVMFFSFQSKAYSDYGNVESAFVWVDLENQQDAFPQTNNFCDSAEEEEFDDDDTTSKLPSQHHPEFSAIASHAKPAFQFSVVSVSFEVNTPPPRVA